MLPTCRCGTTSCGSVSPPPSNQNWMNVRCRNHRFTVADRSQRRAKDSSHAMLDHTYRRSHPSWASTCNEVVGPEERICCVQITDKGCAICVPTVSQLWKRLCFFLEGRGTAKLGHCYNHVHITLCAWDWGGSRFQGDVRCAASMSVERYGQGSTSCISLTHTLRDQEGICKDVPWFHGLTPSFLAN